MRGAIGDHDERDAVFTVPNASLLGTT